MRKATQWIAAKFIKDHRRINDLTVRARYGSLEGWVSIIGNTILFSIKIIAALSIKSVSLTADAVHTLADSATSVVILIGFKMAKKPSDKEHPFGHGKMEFLATLIVSVLLFVAGIELLEKSIHNIITPVTSTASITIILIIVGTIIIKEMMARFSYALGDIIDSKALRADALHHRSDVIATGLVVAALIASRFGYTRLDGIMGVFVSGIIFYSAYEIAKEAANPLLGEAPSKEIIKEIESIAKKHDGVLGVHDIIFSDYASTRIIVLHIEVSDKKTASSLHALSEAIEEEISGRFGGTTVVHIDPINKDHPQYEAIARAIKEIISEDKRVNSFHELRIVGCGAEKCNVVFDIALREDVNEQENYDIVRSIQERFKARFPKMKTIIKAEPKYKYNL